MDENEEKLSTEQPQEKPSGESDEFMNPSNAYNGTELKNIQAIQKMRMSMLQKVALDDRGGVVVPNDTEDRNFVRGLMLDYERSATDRAKLKVTSDANETLSDVNAAVSQLLLTYRVGQELGEVNPEDRKLPDNIKPTLVPGNMEVGTQVLSREEIIGAQE